jgi:predicted AAA+ superfamily ATPase
VALDKSQKTLIALLTPTQMAYITNDASNQPLLIIGSAGTGKTFLVMNKIKQLRQRITEVARAMVIAKCDQMCLLHTLKNDLRDYEHVVIEPVNCLSLEELVEHLNNRIPEDIKFVFVDQLEDFVHDQHTDDSIRNNLCLKSGKFDVAWFLWNSGMYANKQQGQKQTADYGKGKRAYVHLVM